MQSRRVVLVIQRDGEFSSYLSERGFKVVNLELIRTEEAADLSHLDTKIEHIDQYDGVFITSPVAAEIFARRLTAGNRNFNRKFYVLGNRARDALAGYGLNVVSRPEANTAADLIRCFEESEFAGKNFLFVRGEKSLETIPQLLASRARLDTVVVYRTLEVEPEDELLRSVSVQLETGAVACICFFSPSGVESFVRFFGSGHCIKTIAAAIGETTADRAREAGFRVDLVSPKSNARAFAESFATRFETND